MVFMSLLVSMVMSRSQFTFVIPDQDLLPNCLEAQSQEVSSLELRIAELEYQLRLANVRAGLSIEGPKRNEKSAENDIRNPSFDCKCSNQTANFKFGYGGEFVVTIMESIISGLLNVPSFSLFGLFQIALT